jgi:calcineurin-like phosphoesterase family protein
MEQLYLVEIRLGRTKWRIRQIVESVARDSGTAACRERHPHVTLFGPITLLDGAGPQELLDTIGAIASQYDPLPFTIGGFELREGMHGSVIAFSVTPSESLRRLIADLALALPAIACSHNIWDDRPDRKWFHVTIANRLDHRKAAAAFAALTGDRNTAGGPARGFLDRAARFLRGLTRAGRLGSVHPPLIDETGLRITVMQGNDILAEYDLLEKRWLFTGHRHDSRSWQETLAAFRRSAGFELAGRKTPDPGDTLLIADLHLGHANIIRYCSRPFCFSDPGEMDRVLIANWNAVATPGTRICHIGDLRYGRTARPAREYRGQLAGDALFIAGNHDGRDPDMVPSAIVAYAGEQFLLVHDPADAPPSFRGWVIHGHHHNNDLRHYPFIDFSHRRINVSAEVAGYVPVSLKETWALVQYRIATGNTAPVLLNYPHIV